MVARSFGCDPVIAQNLGSRDTYVEPVEKTMSGREDYKVYQRLRAKATHKGKPLSKGDTPAMEEKKRAYARIEQVHVEKEQDPIERKSKFIFDRSNRPARPHGQKHSGYVAIGGYTGKK